MRPRNLIDLQLTTCCNNVKAKKKAGSPLLQTRAVHYRLALIGFLWFCFAGASVNAGVGSVIAWGTNSYGQLDVPAGISDTVQVAAGWDHSLALLSNGTIVGWGRNDHSQTEVPADATNVLRIAAGPGDSFAIGQDATLVGWGSTSYGMFTNHLSLSGINSVSEGWDYKMVVKTDGTVLSWGQPGYGLTNASKALRDIIAVAAGGSHGIALRANGTIAVWGANDYGQTNMPKNLTNVIAIAAGQEHSVALREDGTVVAWGRNLYGMTNVPVGLSNVVAIAAGFRHTLALVSDGTVVAWGKNDSGQSSVPAGLSNVCSIAAGGDTFSGFSLAAVSDGSPRMTIQPSDLTLDAGNGFRLQGRAVGSSSLYYQWRVSGRDIGGATNSFLAIQQSNTSDSGAYDVVVSNSFGSVTSLVARVTIKPSDVLAWGENAQSQTAVPADLTNAISISAGAYHSLAVKPDGTVAAWGSNSSGESTVPDSLTDCVSVAAGLFHSLALKSDGTVVGWGRAPLIPSAATNLISIAVGDAYCVGLKTDGTLLAWGNSPFCQCTNVPAGSNFVAISARDDSGMALKSDGTISAWGVNVPRPPSGISNVVSIAVGHSHALALKADGTVQGWGDNTRGQLRFPPDLTNVVAITAGWEYSLALKSDGTVVGWGNGNSSGIVVLITNLPPDLANVVQLATGMFHNVAVRSDGSPHFTIQPWNRAISARGNMTLCAKAVGTPPLTYQWQLNGVGVAGATHDFLILTNPPPSATGAYRLVVSNSHGSTASSSAVVNVTPLQFDGSVGAVQQSSTGFRSRLLGASGMGNVTILSSTNLIDWAPIRTNQPTTGVIEFLDQAATNGTFQFYRALEQ